MTQIPCFPTKYFSLEEDGALLFHLIFYTHQMLLQDLKEIKIYKILS